MIDLVGVYKVDDYENVHLLEMIINKNLTEFDMRTAKKMNFHGTKNI